MELARPKQVQQSKSEITKALVAGMQKEDSSLGLEEIFSQISETDGRTVEAVKGSFYYQPKKVAKKVT